MEHMPPRRYFLRVLAMLVNGAIAAAMALPALRFLGEPLRRKRTNRGFLRVLPLADLPDGEPIQVVLTAGRNDAYVAFPPGPIGQVWLLRTPDASPDGEPRVRCLNTVCPHLGCVIDYSPEGKAFSCPCHASEFDEGGRRRFGPSPRGMDELECRLTAPDQNGRRWVEVLYEEFQTGIPEKRAIG